MSEYPQLAALSAPGSDLEGALVGGGCALARRGSFMADA